MDMDRCMALKGVTGTDPDMNMVLKDVTDMDLATSTAMRDAAEKALDQCMVTDRDTAEEITRHSGEKDFLM